MAFDEKQWQGLQKRYHLTPRELQIAILVFEGLDNNEIAKKLEISYNTVRAHLQNIYRRVGTRNKVTLVLKFVDNVKENLLKKIVKMTNADDYKSRWLLWSPDLLHVSG